ncbi:uncharacterized protein LOC143834708 [Paroedura picta]|uniref:uncharacterized protein LOC143834708 n=1 Tax=Paroedura picta TaxID=143630 RepID=UPI004056850C
MRTGPWASKIFSQHTFGHVVAKLSVSLADPEAEVREKAREVFGQLMQLQQKKQGRSQFTWEEDPERPWRESYAHLITAAEVFGGHLSARQRLSLQEAALEDALSLDGRWVREGGLLVLLSLLGQARALLEEEEEIEDLRSNLSALLYNMWRGREVPPEIAALLPSSGNVPLRGIRGGEGAVALGLREGPGLWLLHTKAPHWPPGNEGSSEEIPGCFSPAQKQVGFKDMSL